MAVAAGCAALTLLAPALAWPLPERLGLAPGQRASLHTPGVFRLAVGDSSVVEVKPVGSDAVEVHGQAPGKTVIQVWAQQKRHRYQITIRWPGLGPGRPGAHPTGGPKAGPRGRSP